MKKLVSFSLILSMLTFLVAACAGPEGRGAGIGAAVGGLAGAILDRRNPWRGGVIGGAFGAIAGASVADIATQGERQAVDTGRPVEYRTEDGRGVYRADPMPEDESTHCKKVHERIWEDGKLVKDRVKEICEGEKYENRY